MMWLVSWFRRFLASLRLPRTFGIDAGRLHAVLQDRSVDSMSS